MEQDTHTCPGCGAPAPDHLICPYCGWTPERAAEPISSENPASTESPSTQEASDPTEGTPQAEWGEPAQLRDLLKQKDDPEPLLEQVPEELRGVLAARLKAANQSGGPGFSDNTASDLRGQGFVISEDARGARLTGIPGQASELSPSDVVKMAAELEGGVQEQAKLPICGECQAASPVDATHCQWCGQPFSEDQ